MNLVGKIFVVLILVMSIAFMSFTVMVYATHTNWMDEVAKGKTSLEESKKENLALNETLNARTAEYNSEVAGALQARGKLESEYQQMAASRDTLAEQVATMTQAQTEAIKTSTLAQQKYESVRGERDALLARIKETETSQTQQFTKATTLQDRLQVATGQLEILKDREKQLVADLTKLRTIVKNLPSAAATTAAPRVDGVVLAASGDLIEISVGSDDGIEVGHFLDVYRESKYLGRVRILKADPDRCVGTILRDYSQGTIQKGDRVSSSRQA